MDTTQKVDRFIAAKRSERDRRGEDIAPLPPGTLPFLTISSQSGAGGRQLSETLMELLEEDTGDEVSQRWRTFDKSMCRYVLEEEHLAESMGELLEEEYHSQIAEFVMGIFGDRGMQNVAYARLARVLRTIASVGRVIVLGHGGCMATRDLAGGIHVRLVAPLPTRAARMASLLEVEEGQAMRTIRQRDEEQRKLLKTHYRVDSADPELYDLVCNTERMSPRTVAELVLALLRKRSG